jgi:glycosyltransferase involved in cell wall biosynthesis
MEKIEKDSFPLISIVTVVYNGAATIEQTIRSVVEQSYPNKEYIIIDGGSTDGTLDIIKKYTHQIDYFKSEADEGIFDAMNKGIKIAKGEIIGIINADDWYEKDIFSTVAEICQNSGKPLVIHGLLRNFLEDQFYSIKGPNATRVARIGFAASGVIATVTTMTTAIAAHGQSRAKWPPMIAAQMPRAIARSSVTPATVRAAADKSSRVLSSVRSFADRTRNTVNADTPWAPNARITKNTCPITTHG